MNSRRTSRKMPANSTTDHFVKILDHEESADDTYIKAANLYYQGNYDEAARLARRSMKGNPRNPKAWKLLSEALLHAEKWQEAARAFEKYLTLILDDVESWADLGWCWYMAKRLDLAEKAYSTAIRLDNSCHEALYGMALVLVDENQFDRALVLCKKAVSINPAYPSPWYDIAWLEQGAENLVEALSSIKKFLELEPEDEEGHYLLACILSDSGDIDLASVEFEQIVKKNPKYYDAWESWIIMLYNENDLKKAARVCGEYVLKNPSNVKYQVILGELHEMLKNYRAAMLAYTRALEIDEECIDAMYGMAQTLENIGQLDEAISWLENIVSIDPRNASAWFRISLVEEDRGYRDNAIKAMYKHVEIKPDSFDGHYLLGLLLVKAGDKIRAIKEFQKAFNLDSSRASSWESWVLALMQDGYN